jgi:osmoprotectant transport system permease protein
VNPVAAAWSYALANQHVLAAGAGRHLGLSAAALGVAALLCIPLGVWTARHRAGATIIGVVTALRSVPSLAVLALMLPLLGLGFAPALVALVLLAIPPILINTDIGYRSVDRAAIEAAVGMGMRPAQVLRRVETPLAAPVIVTGLRTAAVEVIASATLAAFIGGGGLGDLIVGGLENDNGGELLLGAACVALLALAAEALFSGLGRLLSAPSLREQT